MVFGARLGAFLLLSMLCVSEVSAEQSSTASDLAGGRISLDVVVTPKAGAPVPGLPQQDFTVLVNKVPQPITWFHAIRGRQSHLKVILVIDDVNTGFERVAFERSEVDNFLRAEGGRLPYPTMLAILGDSGLTIQSTFSSDGNALSAALDKYNVMLHTIWRSGGIYAAIERFELSMNALLQLAAQEATLPGRKMMVWISPGWPLLSAPGLDVQIDFQQRRGIYEDVVNVSRFLRHGGITLYNVDPLGSSDFLGRAFYWQAFVDGISKVSQAEWGNVALQALAVRSGGLALTWGTISPLN